MELTSTAVQEVGTILVNEKSSLINDTQRAVVMTALKNGATINDAARLAGLSVKWFHAQVLIGRGDVGFENTESTKLAVEVDGWRAQFRMFCLANVRKAAETDWRAAHAALKMSAADEYGDTLRVEVTTEEVKEVRLRELRQRIAEQGVTEEVAVARPLKSVLRGRPDWVVPASTENVG
jgi:hypothetical protein